MPMRFGLMPMRACRCPEGIPKYVLHADCIGYDPAIYYGVLILVVV